MQKRTVLMSLILMFLLSASTAMFCQTSQGSSSPDQGASQPGVGIDRQPDSNSSDPAVQPGQSPRGAVPGYGDTSQPIQPRRAAWPWFLAGFILGLIIGAVAWRRPRSGVGPSVRRDRAA